MSFFSENQKALQKKFGGEKVAERLLEHRVNTIVSVSDKTLIEGSSFFFIASGGGPTIDCSIKSGDPGFVRVISPNEIRWPNYDGNRMFRTLGNMVDNPSVSLLFVNFDNPATKSSSGLTTKLRIIGKARFDDSHDALAEFHGAKQVVSLDVDYVFPNCPRYLPSMALMENSPFTPRPDYEPPVPEWKTRDYIAEIIDEN